MSQFFQKPKREMYTDGEALVEWDIDATDITVEDIRSALKGKTGKKAGKLAAFRKKTHRHPLYVYGGTKDKPVNFMSLTNSLKKSMLEPAGKVPVVREFCDKVGLDPDMHTVGDVIIQCQLYYALSGSAPHFMHLFDRIEGKIPQQTEIKMDGKAGISEAMAAMCVADSAGQLDYEEDPEADKNCIELLTGCKNADVVSIEDDAQIDDEFEDDADIVGSDDEDAQDEAEEEME